MPVHSAIRLKPKTVVSHLHVPKISVKFKKSNGLTSKETKNADEAIFAGVDSDDNFDDPSAANFNFGFNNLNLNENFSLKAPQIGKDFPENISESATKAYQELEHETKIDVLSEILTSVRRASINASNTNTNQNMTFTSTLEAMVSKIKIYDFSQISDTKSLKYPGFGPTPSKNSNYEAINEDLLQEEIQANEMPLEPDEGWLPRRFLADRHDGPFSRERKFSHPQERQTSRSLDTRLLHIVPSSDEHRTGIFPDAKRREKSSSPHKHLQPMNREPSTLLEPIPGTDLKSSATNLPVLANIKPYGQLEQTMPHSIFSKTLTKNQNQNNSKDVALSSLLFISNKPRDKNDVNSQNESISRNTHKHKGSFTSTRLGVKMTMSQKIGAQRQAMENKFLEMAVNDPGKSLVGSRNRQPYRVLQPNPQDPQSQTNPTGKIQKRQPTIERSSSKGRKFNKMKSFNLAETLPEAANPSNYTDMQGDSKDKKPVALHQKYPLAKPKNQRGQVPDILQKILTSFAYVAALVGPDGKILNVGPGTDNGPLEQKNMQTPDFKNFVKFGVGASHQQAIKDKIGMEARPNSALEDALEGSMTASEKINKILEKRKTSRYGSKLSGYTSTTEGELRAELMKSYAEEIIERSGQGKDLFSDIAHGAVLMDNTENLDILLAEKQARLAKNGPGPPGSLSDAKLRQLGGSMTDAERKAKLAHLTAGGSPLPNSLRSHSADTGLATTGGSSSRSYRSGRRGKRYRITESGQRISEEDQSYTEEEVEVEVMVDGVMVKKKVKRKKWKDRKHHNRSGDGSDYDDSSFSKVKYRTGGHYSGRKKGGRSANSRQSDYFSGTGGEDDYYIDDQGNKHYTSKKQRDRARRKNRQSTAKRHRRKGSGSSFGSFDSYDSHDISAIESNKYSESGDPRRNRRKANKISIANLNDEDEKAFMRDLRKQRRKEKLNNKYKRIVDENGKTIYIDRKTGKQVKKRDLSFSESSYWEGSCSHTCI